MKSVERVARPAAPATPSSTSWPSDDEQLAGDVHPAHALGVDVDVERVGGRHRHPQAARVAPHRGRVGLDRARRPRRVADLVAGRARRAARAVSATVRVSTPSQARNDSPRSGPRETRPRLGLRPDEAAAGGGDAERAAAVVAVRHRQHAGRDRRGRAAGGAAGRARRGPTGCASGRCGAARWSAGSRTPACSSCRRRRSRPRAGAARGRRCGRAGGRRGTSSRSSCTGRRPGRWP